MSNLDELDDLKRKIRKLKTLEIKIRFGNAESVPRRAVLVWDELFDLKSAHPKAAKYTMDRLASMDKDAYKGVLDEFFFRVYDRYYHENGMTGAALADPAKLALLGLPCDADQDAVKARFRELAKAYHPDHGGDSEKFIGLMKMYRELTDR